MNEPGGRGRGEVRAMEGGILAAILNDFEWLAMTVMCLLVLFMDRFSGYNLPYVQLSPFQPGRQKHRYHFLVNPDWQEPPFWQG